MTEQSSKYWNPWLETLDPERRLAIELKNFRRMFQYAKDHSVFYRQRYQDIFPEDIRSLEAVRQLPLLDKEDLRKAQEGQEPFPYGEMLGVDLTEVSHFRQTSGTTGRPVYVPESYESWQWRIEIWCHILWMAGFRETDRVFIPFGYNVYVAFWEGHYAAEKLGCEVVPGGALDTRGRISKIREVRATALLNTPTYGLHLAEEVVKMGLDPKTLGIKRMLCAGEPLPPATRHRLEQLWGAEVYDHIGGTEPCAWAGHVRRAPGPAPHGAFLPGGNPGYGDHDPGGRSGGTGGGGDHSPRAALFSPDPVQHQGCGPAGERRLPLRTDHPDDRRG